MESDAKQRRRWRYEFAVQLRSIGKNLPFDTFETLCSNVRQLRRCHEKECSFAMDQDEYARHQRRVARLESRIATLCAPYRVEFNADPRGPAARLVVSSDRVWPIAE